MINLLIIISQFLFAQSEGIPGKQESFCKELDFRESSSVVCRYQSVIDADDVIQNANNILDTDLGLQPEDISLQTVDGHSYIIQFVAPDEKMAKQILAILRASDLRTYDYKKVHITLQYYFLSHSKSTEAGLNLNIIADGPVPANLPTAAGSVLTGMAFNMGNLTNYLVNLNMNLARNLGVMENSETYDIPTYDGYRFDTGTSQELYYSNAVSIDNENIQKGFSGVVRLDKEDPRKIYVDGLSFSYPELLESDNTLARTSNYALSSTVLKSGVTQIIFARDIKKKLTSSETHLLGKSGIKAEESLKFIVTITATYEDDVAVNNEITKMNYQTNLPYFTEAYYAGEAYNDTYPKPKSGNEFAFRAMLNRNFVEITTMLSAVSKQKQKLAFMLSPDNIYLNVLDRPIVLKVKSGKQKLEEHINLSNLIAGPIIFDGIELGYSEDKQFNDISISIELDTKNIPNAADGIKPTIATYEYIQNPRTGEIRTMGYAQFDKDNDCYLVAHSEDPKKLQKWLKKSCF